MAYARKCIRPAYDYFRSSFGDKDLGPMVQAFKVARLFNPRRALEIQPMAEDVDKLKAFPFLQDTEQLKRALPPYVALSEGVKEVDVLDWWHTHQRDLPASAEACKNVLLIQLSSAAAERAFSILSNSFGERQESSLQDYIESSIMLQYNGRGLVLNDTGHVVC